MPSLRAKLINRLVRRSFKSLPLADMEPSAVRAHVDALNGGVARLRALAPVRGVSIETVAAPIAGEWQRPEAHTTDRVILYLHGGGYVFCSPRTHRSLTVALAKMTNAPVFSLDYRLAPEHPCPAAIEDAVAAYEMVLAARYSPGNVYVGGDSAGGGLALALLQRLRAEDRPMPGGAFLYSPWTDLTVSGRSAVENAEADAMFTLDTIQRGAHRYAGDLPLDDPRVSPLFGSFKGLPPLLIFASADEILRDDAVRLHDAASAEGIDSTLIVEDGLVHVWPVFYPLMPEARETIATTADFVAKSA
ncbi:MAG: alpha/beta hydrolase [Pseudomonadota bacterium]